MENSDASKSVVAGSVGPVDQLTKSSRMVTVKRGTVDGLPSGPFYAQLISGGYKLGDAQLQYLEASFAKNKNPTKAKCLILAENVSVPSCAIISNWFEQRRLQDSTEE